MSAAAIGTIGIGVLLLLLVMRVPVAFAMFGVGFAGITILQNSSSAQALLASESFTLASSP